MEGLMDRDDWDTTPNKQMFKLNDELVRRAGGYAAWRIQQLLAADRKQRQEVSLRWLIFLLGFIIGMAVGWKLGVHLGSIR
jgi:hypothetical protein